MTTSTGRAGNGLMLPATTQTLGTPSAQVPAERTKQAPATPSSVGYAALGMATDTSVVPQEMDTRRLLELQARLQAHQWAFSAAARLPIEVQDGIAQKLGHPDSATLLEQGSADTLKSFAAAASLAEAHRAITQAMGSHDAVLGFIRGIR